MAALAPAANGENAARSAASVAAQSGLSYTGMPAPGVGYYYGGPPITLISGSGAFKPRETVWVYLGTPLTGTLLMTKALASTSGQLHVSVAVPDVYPDWYLFSAVGQTSMRTRTARVPIAPVVRPTPVQGTTGTLVSMSGAGYRPNEPIAVYMDAPHAGAPGGQHNADVLVVCLGLVPGQPQ